MGKESESTYIGFAHGLALVENDIEGVFLDRVTRKLCHSKLGFGETVRCSVRARSRVKRGKEEDRLGSEAGGSNGR